MRHRKAKSLNNRFTSWRKATLISLARNLLVYQSIKTTRIRARSARPLVEKLINLAKANTLAAKRQAFAILGDHRLVSLLFKEIGPRFAQRVGGYLRILHLDSRRGDGAEMVLLELTEIKKKEIKKPKKQKEAKTEAQPTAGPTEEAKPAAEEKKAKTEVATKEKEERPPVSKKPSKKFLGGLRSIFKKERDSL